jgi:hypothetical protein
MTRGHGGRIGSGSGSGKVGPATLFQSAASIDLLLSERYQPRMRAPYKGTSKLSEAAKTLRAAGRALFIIVFIVLTVAVQVIWIAVIVWFLFRLFRYVALALLVGTAIGACMAPPSRPTNGLVAGPRRARMRLRWRLVAYRTVDGNAGATRVAPFGC